MVKHMVMWTLKETAEGRSKAENLRLVKDKLEALASKINVIRALEVGVNFTDSQEAFDIALYAEFASPEDLTVYQEHPGHVEAREFIRRVRDKRRVVDYQI